MVGKLLNYWELNPHRRTWDVLEVYLNLFICVHFVNIITHLLVYIGVSFKTIVLKLLGDLVDIIHDTFGVKEKWEVGECSFFKFELEDKLIALHNSSLITSEDWAVLGDPKKGQKTAVATAVSEKKQMCRHLAIIPEALCQVAHVIAFFLLLSCRQWEIGYASYKSTYLYTCFH